MSAKQWEQSLCKINRKEAVMLPLKCKVNVGSHCHTRWFQQGAKGVSVCSSKNHPNHILVMFKLLISLCRQVPAWGSDLAIHRRRFTTLFSNLSPIVSILCDKNTQNPFFLPSLLFGGAVGLELDAGPHLLVKCYRLYLTSLTHVTLLHQQRSHPLLIRTGFNRWTKPREPPLCRSVCVDSTH